MSTPVPSLASSVNANPADQNLLQASTFQVSFTRLPYPMFFCQEVNIPGIDVPPVYQPTTFINAPVPGNKLTYENFVMKFAVDEGLWAWTSIADWLKGIGIPESFQEYQNLSLQQRLQMKVDKPQYSDAILTILSNKNNPLLTVQFSDMFPVSLTGIQFSTQQDASTIITATATFGFTSAVINRQV